ncbi:hypothetical protein FRAHR75_480035 [Frankia sp. Hr75.2]|nr:hypothetical protein FRAHR75_480035 [Frankia sp. Hr75.2]
MSATGERVSATDLVEDLPGAGPLADRADHVGGQHALLGDQLQQRISGRPEIRQQVEVADGGRLAHRGVVLRVVLERHHGRERVGEEPLGEVGAQQDPAVREEDLRIGVLRADAHDGQVLVVLLDERDDRARGEVVHGVDERVEILHVGDVEVVSRPSLAVTGDRYPLGGHCLSSRPFPPGPHVSSRDLCVRRPGVMPHHFCDSHLWVSYSSTWGGGCPLMSAPGHSAGGSGQGWVYPLGGPPPRARDGREAACIPRTARTAHSAGWAPAAGAGMAVWRSDDDPPSTPPVLRPYPGRARRRATGR